MHELKLIVDLFYQGGMAYMRYSISDTAEYGDYTRGPRVIDAHVRETMRQILKEVQSGAFASEWISENQAGRPRFLALRKQDAEHPHRKDRQGAARHDERHPTEGLTSQKGRRTRWPKPASN